MRIDEVSPLVHRADPIGVAVGRQSQVPQSRADRAGERAEVALDRLRMNPAETGVELPANLGDFAASPLKKIGDDAAPGPS